MSSQIHKDVLRSIRNERIKAAQNLANLTSENVPPVAIKPFRAGFFLQVLELTKRALWNNLRHPGFYWSRMFIYILLDLVIGAMFVRSTKVDDEYKAGMIFFVQSYLVIMTVAALPYLILIRPVFSKERANGLITVLPFVISTFLAMIPGITAATLISAFLIFTMAGLVEFGWFFWILFCTMLCAESIMNLVASLTNQFIVGLAIGAGIYGIFMINSGFLLPHYKIPNTWYTGWKIFHHGAFHSYSLRCLMHNEFRSSKYYITSTIDGSCIHGYDSPALDRGNDDVIPGLKQSTTVATNNASSTLGPTDLCSPILTRYDMEDVNMFADTLFLLLYTFALQVFLFAITFFKHTGKR